MFDQVSIGAVKLELGMKLGSDRFVDVIVGRRQIRSDTQQALYNVTWQAATASLLAITRS